MRFDLSQLDSLRGNQNCLEQVGKLLRGKVVAFDVGDEFAIPADDRGVLGMNEESFLGDEGHSEPVTYTLDIGGCSGQETPVFRVGFPCFLRIRAESQVGRGPGRR